MLSTGSKIAGLVAASLVTSMQPMVLNPTTSDVPRISHSVARSFEPPTFVENLRFALAEADRGDLSIARGGAAASANAEYPTGLTKEGRLRRCPASRQCVSSAVI